jgi:hypothetical protein
MIEALRELHQSGLITDLDWYFARFLQQQAARDSDYLALAAVLVSRAIAQGDVCIDLGALAAKRIVFEDTLTQLQAPAWKRRRLSVLRGSIVP